MKQITVNDVVALLVSIKDFSEEIMLQMPDLHGAQLLVWQAQLMQQMAADLRTHESLVSLEKALQ